MKKILAIAVYLLCTAQNFNPPAVNSNQVVTGATIGQCLTANPGGYIMALPCTGGPSSSNFPNGITTGVSGTAGPFAIVGTHSGTVTLSSTAVDVPNLCVEVPNANFDALVIRNNHSGEDIVCIDSNGTLSTATDINAPYGQVEGFFVIGGNSSGTGTGFGSGGYQDGSGAGDGAIMQLGRTGAPTGACTSGSIYTRSDGTTGASVYNCMTSAWVAAPSP
jgi:hypothetical protein